MFFRDTVLDVFVSFNIPHIFNDEVLKEKFKFIMTNEYYEKIESLRKGKKSNLGFIQNVGAITLTHNEHWYQIFKAFHRISRKLLGLDYYVEKNYLPPLVPLKVTSKHAVRTYIANEESRTPVIGRLQVFLYPIGTGVIRVRFPIIQQTNARTIIKFMHSIYNNKIEIIYRSKKRRVIEFLSNIKVNILKSLFVKEAVKNIWINLSDFKFALHLGGSTSISLKSRENKAMVTGFLRLKEDYQNFSSNMINIATKYKLSPFLKGDLFYFSKKVALAYTPILFGNKHTQSRKRFRKRFFSGIELTHMVNHGLFRIDEITTYVIANSLEKIPVLINTFAISLNPYLLGCINIENAPGLITPYSVEKFFIEQGKAIELYKRYETTAMNFKNLIKDLVMKNLLDYIEGLCTHSSDEFKYAFDTLYEEKSKQFEKEITSHNNIVYHDELSLQTDWMKVLNYLANAYVYDHNLEKQGIPSDGGWRRISAISKATKIRLDRFYRHRTKGRQGIISLLQEEQLIIVDKREEPKSKRRIIKVRINPHHTMAKFIINTIEKFKERNDAIE